MDWALPYPSRRQPVLGDAVVATSQPLAAQAGLAMLQRGGNAVDAAVAAAIALTVVEPTSNGIGGDAFAMVSNSAGVWALNGSGRAPRGIDTERLRSQPAIPLRGWDAVTVPGAVSAWVALSSRFGRLSFEELFGPAVRWAREGWLVGPVTAAAWRAAEGAFREREDFATVFLPGGHAPRAGQRFACPDQADTLARIAASGGLDFYEGETAGRLVSHAAAEQGAITAEDLADHAPEWVQPLALELGGHVVWEPPPNGQGIAALEALGILAHTNVAELPPDSPDAVHLQAEAMKLAFADAHRFVADPMAMELDPAALLSPGYLLEQAGRIDSRQAADPDHGRPGPGGTVYLATADADGMAVSFIQSNFYGFGSGIVVPGTGVALQNRGAGFVTADEHPNVIAPGKRPFHTIVPGMVTQRGEPAVAFGVMGGPMQPQGHVQLLQRMLLWGQNPQAACDAPRWRVAESRKLLLEEGFTTELAQDLGSRGHTVVSEDTMGGFGGAQVVARTPSGWLGASDPRKEGQAVAW